MTQAPSKKMTYEEFLAWCDEDTWAEWVDGEVVMVSPASLSHQDIGWWLGRIRGPRDRGEKYYEYEAAGVREYWLIGPDRQQAEFYRLNQGKKRYELIPPEGVYRSQVVPGFWLKVSWLWQRPLPRVLDVLRELKLI